MVLAKFFEERKYLLWCLSTILGASSHNDLPTEVEGVVRDFASHLVSQGRLIELALERLKVLIVVAGLT